VWLWCLFLSQVSWDQRCGEIAQFVTNKMDIRGLHSAKGHCYLYYPQLYSSSFKKSAIELILCLPPSFAHIQCRQTDLHRRQPILLQQVGFLAHINAQRTMWENQMIMLEIHRAKTVISGNPPNQFHPPPGIVTPLRRHHFQALPSSTTLPHTTRHQAHNQACRQAKDMRLMGHRGKDTISLKEVMVDLKCSPLSNSQDRGRHLQAHLEYLQHRPETIQWCSWHVPLLLHTGNFPAHLGAPPWASQRNDSSWLRNWAGQILRGLQTCPHYPGFLMKNSMQIMGVMIHRTWVGPKAKPYSAWSKRNCPGSNLPQGWGSRTSVPSTSWRKDG